MTPETGRQNALLEITELIASTRTLLESERANARRDSRRWATLVLFLLFLGTLVFGLLAWRQEVIVGDLKEEARQSCELRNANEALLRTVWTKVGTELADQDPEVAQVYSDAADEMRGPKDCSIFVR